MGRGGSGTREGCAAPDLQPAAHARCARSFYLILSIWMLGVHVCHRGGFARPVRVGGKKRCESVARRIASTRSEGRTHRHTVPERAALCTFRQRDRLVRRRAVGQAGVDSSWTLEQVAAMLYPVWPALALADSCVMSPIGVPVTVDGWCPSRRWRREREERRPVRG